MMKRFTGVRGTIILVVLIMGIIGYYFYLSNRTEAREEQDTTLTNLQTVLLKDLENDYPPTVKEVIKYFSEITLCLYDGKVSDNDIEKLAAKEILLFDEDLLENNPWSDYLVDLKKDLEDFKDKELTVTGYTPAGSTSVFYFPQDGREWARIYCTYYIKSGKDNRSVFEVFLLRKDENGRWKIFGWDLAENVNTE